MAAILNMLDEIDTPIDELVRLHTGHQLQNSDSDDESENEDRFKPKLRSLNELNAKLGVVVEKPKVTNGKQNSLKSHKRQRGKKPQITKKDSTTSLKLIKMITPRMCFICNPGSFNAKHYKTKKHLKKLRAWAFSNGGFTENTINTLYCHPCNEVFIDSTAALVHYQSWAHKKIAKSYCKYCEKFVTNMENHIQIKTHIARQRNSNYKDVDIPTYSIKHLNSSITLSECKVCALELASVEVATEHYQSESHNINVQNWMDEKNSSESNSHSESDNDDFTLKNQIAVTLKSIIDKVYFSKTIPMSEALAYLKRLNENIDKIARPSHSPSITETVPDILDLDIQPLTLTAEEHAQNQLKMEFARLKLVLISRCQIPEELALHFLQGFIWQIEKAINDESDLAAERQPVEITGETVEKAIGILENKLFNFHKINPDLAVDLIMQVNIELENYIEQEKNELL